jgi:NhaA family Na+:H+ antiporter
MSPATTHAHHAITRVSRFLSNSLFALPVGCVAALVWSNTLPESYFRLAHALAFVVNDIGLAFFLGLVMKEVIEATLPDGALHTWRRAALPLAAAVGGSLVPIAGFLLFLRGTGEAMLRPAWVVTSAVDIAGCYIAGRVIFGRHAAVSFLLLLAIGIDAIGLVALAIWHPIDDVHFPRALGLMALAIGSAIALRRSGVRSFWWYLLGPGVLSWWALFLGGIQPAIALMPIMPFMPHATRDTGLFVEPTPQAHDTLTNFERGWGPPVQGILLLFGLVNAGVSLHGLEQGIWAVPVAVLIGRPIGVIGATWLAVVAGLHLPRNVHWPDVAVIGCISSIGLVMALFFVAAAMPIGPLQDELKVGALLTTAGAIVALTAAQLLRVGRFAR